MAHAKELTLDFELDPKTMTGRSQFGNFKYSVGLKPFMGIMGMPPNEKGQHTTFAPRPYGGNLDCKELTAGGLVSADPGGWRAVLNRGWTCGSGRRRS